MNRIVLSDSNSYSMKRAKAIFDKFFFFSVEYYAKSKNKRYNELKEPFQYDYNYILNGYLKELFDPINEITGSKDVIVMVSITKEKKFGCKEGVFYLNLKENQMKRIQLVSDKLKKWMQGYNVCVSLLISIEEATINGCTRKILDDLLSVGAVQQKILEIANDKKYVVQQYTENVLALSHEIGVNKAHLYLITNIMLNI